MMLIRLNKFLSQAGVASRREADSLIASGRIKVNGEVVREMGYKMDIERDTVEVDGVMVQKKDHTVYLMMNKPRGYLVTIKDPFHRPKITDLLSALETRVFPVGRLDCESEGLLILTDDGELAHRLTHPKYEIKKMYQVIITGHPVPGSLERLKKGIILDGRRTAPARVEVVSEEPGQTVVMIEIHEGRKREVRRMFESLGHDVLSLKRVQFAGLSLGPLRSGEWRYLKEKEVLFLKRQVDL